MHSLLQAPEWEFDVALDRHPETTTDGKNLLMTAMLDYLAESPQFRRPLQRLVNDAVGRTLAKCPYAFVYRRITWRLHDGQLMLRGQVPSFHLKQMLQEYLRGIDGVERIVNDVEVDSAWGLSSMRKEAFPG